ncbi:LuxR C-terminal-related transcriptional regulator [Mycolicibacterium sp. CBMA 226]|uniref:LuxR C-terminal-related transcriptional regulator n=1 Tax=Mycolicibacterium sp. CBMA 226 TaxID=2606611 RepID=UPI0012DF7915|nr:LuxR C-terminal-related transcriptional regulator [Mycolicibacterium sp. CBMA 226]MUL78637.1 response regulator transcription factor [Mycolicibacterium sp. CBMA 226]
MRIDTFAGCQVSRVTVVDSYEVVHAGVSAWLREDCAPCATPTALYPDAEQFLRRNPIPENGGEVVLLGLRADEATGLAAVRELTNRGYRVVVYSHVADRDVIRTAIDSGAVTYLTQTEGREHLIKAIRAAVTPFPYIGPSMATALDDRDFCLRPVLAPREQEVLLAWFRTDSKELAAQQLFVAPSTVRTHLQRIRAKYAAAGRPAGTKAALVARAIQDRIINIDDL